MPTVIDRPDHQAGAGTGAGAASAMTLLEDITKRAHLNPMFDGHDAVWRIQDGPTGLTGFIAIHSTRHGPALGGCRMQPYTSEEDALTDVLRLSAAMSRKAALAGLALGGGKAVIIGNPVTDKTEALFRAFGRAIEELGGRYHTGEDVGTNPTDMDWVARETGYVFGTSDRLGNPAPYTAFGVREGIKAALYHAMGRDTLHDAHIAVQGLGQVGRALCRELAGAGARLTVTDLNPRAVAEMETTLGAKPVAPDEIYDVPADVFAPCALGGTINDETIGRLRCAIVAGSANNQLAAPHFGQELHRRGILYAPDYVINAGGLIAAHVAMMGGGEETARAKIALIGATLTEIFTRAVDERLATSEIADKIASARLDHA